MSRLTFSAYVTRMGSQRTLWWTSPRSYKRVSIACIAAVACLLSGCSAEAKTTSTEEKDVLSAESVMTSVSGNIYEGVVTEPVETGYWSIPLEETYFIDPYKKYKKDGETRYEMIANGEAMTRQTFNDLFTVVSSVGYLYQKELGDFEWTIQVKDGGEDSGNAFSYALMLYPNTSILAAEHPEYDIKGEHDISEYEPYYSVAYSARVVDIYGNVVNTDWDKQYKIDNTTYPYPTGMGSLQELSWHTDGDVAPEQVDYVEFMLYAVADSTYMESKPIFDYTFKVKNVYRATT